MASQPRWGDLPHLPGPQDHEDDCDTGTNTLVDFARSKSKSHKKAGRRRPAEEPSSSAVSLLSLSSFVVTDNLHMYT